jgi:hypothetical protein
MTYDMDIATLPLVILAVSVVVRFAFRFVLRGLR